MTTSLPSIRRKHQFKRGRHILNSHITFYSLGLEDEEKNALGLKLNGGGSRKNSTIQRDEAAAKRRPVGSYWWHVGGTRPEYARRRVTGAAVAAG